MDKRTALLLVVLVVVAGVGWRVTRGPAPPPALEHAWPPRKGEVYPDVELKNHRGELVKLSSFKGKVIVVEPIGMSCPACQAFAGAHDVGAFRGGQPQADLPSFERLLKSEAGLAWRGRTDLVYVHLLLYDMSAAAAPTLEDAREWATHFGLDGVSNAVVLVGDARYVNPASYALVPGFHVIDKNFMLRWDGSGHHPVDDPYDVALAGIPRLLDE